jgi:hypothetical protein
MRSSLFHRHIFQVCLLAIIEFVSLISNITGNHGSSLIIGVIRDGIKITGHIFGEGRRFIIRMMPGGDGKAGMDMTVDTFSLITEGVTVAGQNGWTMVR